MPKTTEVFIIELKTVTIACKECFVESKTLMVTVDMTSAKEFGKNYAMRLLPQDTEEKTYYLEIHQWTVPSPGYRKTWRWNREEQSFHLIVNQC